MVEECRVNDLFLLYILYIRFCEALSVVIKLCRFTYNLLMWGWIISMASNMAIKNKNVFNDRTVI